MNKWPNYPQTVPFELLVVNEAVYSDFAFFEAAAITPLISFNIKLGIEIDKSEECRYVGLLCPV